jgi:hypothetical protein
MTTADKLEIDMLIQNIETMKTQSEKMDELYLNKEVIDYATKAFNNAKDVHKYICDVIQDNITLFFDFSKPIELSTHSCCGDYWVNLRDKSKISTYLGNGIGIVIKVNSNLISNFEVETYKASFRTIPEAITVERVYTYVSDTKSKEYDICSQWDLVFLKGGLDSFYTNGIYNTKQRAEVWNCLYDKAKRTRAKTEMLVRFFKKLLTAKCEYHKKNIDKKEKEFERAKHIDKYENVTF